MTETTPLDTAHAAMEAAPDDDAARLRFYERLADTELFLMLTEEVSGDQISPDLFELPDATFALVFDREDRLAQFAGRAVPYAALSGRAITGMMAGQGIGLGVNLDVAPSAILIPPQAVDWLAQTLSAAPDEVEERIAEFTRPAALPESLLTALDTKLAMTAGLARQAYLVGTTSEAGTKGHLLAFVAAQEDARPALAKAVGEALTFSGLDAGVLDVGFFDPHDPAAAALARHGLRFDLPQPEAPRKVEHVAPGSDPDKPPKLR
ncbi:SseB family protein [Pseudooceanicola nitratireducens]|uniref:SseB family protein n=1 Tax=Pseudooceanicola nitratireducens TaxID=517719 RepID=UPI001C965C6B|nr:SseB family protein [Pseudooceanicola nitratireducens]MBY6156283.1 SseB family protein [Pseudooceanicola nitratireducens]